MGRGCFFRGFWRCYSDTLLDRTRQGGHLSRDGGARRRWQAEPGAPLRDRRRGQEDRRRPRGLPRGMTPSPREDRCPPPRPRGRRRRAPGIGKSCIVLRTSTEAVKRGENTGAEGFRTRAPGGPPRARRGSPRPPGPLVHARPKNSRPSITMTAWPTRWTLPPPTFLTSISPPLLDAWNARISSFPSIPAQ